MDITSLLQESLQPEIASVVEKAIAEAMEHKINEAKVDAATQQAQEKEKSQEQIDNLVAHYENELKVAAKQLIDLEKFYKDQSKIAVDAVLKAYDDKDRLEEHYVSQLKDAAEKYITETSQESVSALKEEVAKYVAEKSELKEAAEKYAEYVRTETLAEMQDMVSIATKEYIKENQEKFDQLDKMARYESTLNTIKESFERIGLGLSEDLAYQGLQESLETKEQTIKSLQESLEAKDAILLVKAKEESFIKLTESYSELQRDKFKRLAESISADNIESFEKTLGYIVESYGTDDTTNSLNESIQTKTTDTTKTKVTNSKDELAKAMISKML